MASMSCSIGKNHHGNLRFRLYWSGMAWTEGTAYKDTPENRKLLEPLASTITLEMKAGKFDYLAHWPEGNKAAYFNKEKTAGEPKTIRRYYADWITQYQPPLVKKSRWRNYRSHFETYILPAHGDKLLHQYGVGDIRALMALLAARRHVHDKGGTQTITVKTIKNILNGSLRALFRDAAAEQLISANPFNLLPPRWWPKHYRPPPDPFTESERDEILDYLRKKLVPNWPAGYVFCYTLFWAGMRPSELTARKWLDIDFRTGKLSITSSRTNGEEGATKTAGSNRTIELFPPVLDLIKSIKPLRAEANDYIFLDRRGKKPIDHWHFGQQHFQAALNVLQIRHRDFYQTRATFISTMLTHGENAKQVAEYCGNSPEVIFAHYAKYLGQTGTFGIAAMAAGNDAEKERAAR